jgi:hypothetical protein
MFGVYKMGQAGLVAWLVIVKSSDQLLTQLATSFFKGGISS